MLVVVERVPRPPCVGRSLIFTDASVLPCPALRCSLGDVDWVEQVQQRLPKLKKLDGIPLVTADDDEE